MASFSDVTSKMEKNCGSFLYNRKSPLFNFPLSRLIKILFFIFVPNAYLIPVYECIFHSSVYDVMKDADDLVVKSHETPVV